MEAHAAVVATDVERDDAWLALRRTGLGGSDAAPALGMSAYQGQFELYLHKRGELPDVEDNRFMEWGRELEPVIARMYARQAGVVLCDPRVLLRSVRWPWMLATPDRLIGPSPSEATEGLELKNVGARQAWKWQDGEAPAEHLLQCHHYLAVTGLPRWRLVGFVGGNELVEVAVERDESLLANLAEAERVFWERVTEGRPPPADEGSAGAIRQRWPEAAQGSVVEVDPQVLEWIEHRARAKAAITEATTELNLAENTIKAAIGEAEAATVGGQVVATWKTSQRAGYVVEPATVRTLRIPKNGGR